VHPTEIADRDVRAAEALQRRGPQLRRLARVLYQAGEPILILFPADARYGSDDRHLHSLALCSVVERPNERGVVRRAALLGVGLQHLDAKRLRGIPSLEEAAQARAGAGIFGRHERTHSGPLNSLVVGGTENILERAQP